MPTRSLILLSALALSLSAAPAKKPKKAVAAPFDAALLKPETLTEQAPATFRVKFQTTRGAFTIRVTRAWAPLGADRFYNLAKHHFFDGTAFFRMLPGFVAQWGINGRPDVSKAWSEATIKDDPVTQSNKKGRVTFALDGPASRTTQLFINLRDNIKLDTMGFAPFGEVEEPGLKVVESFFAAYGEGAPRGLGPDQGRIEKEGQKYLEDNFSMLDRIQTTTLLEVPKPRKKQK